ncbi:IS1182 family transposase [Nannocystis pusilla]|uniref:IS1182 family transposase n=1 Tax=Nannocystis pusilla TaxID=889268 RepID=A0ABS7U3D3_9BACT|nr:IS1182 family transposase [Nannocystis pusilla]MBZ5709149.1 IS1182 family transposase [Nannocystis pusilla]MBZ5715049.1 IS1182 family transposase [Nannocystis pusilla]
MSKTFRPWEIDQLQLLPPSVHELVPEGHVAHFVRDLVRESLDLSEIFGAYTEERGQPPFHPAMMTALLLYAYSQGVFSSRKIAQACEQRVDFMAVTACQRPDHRTVNDFRRRHLPALGGLFGQVLRLCQKAGLVKLGHVALDGTKIKANASKHKAMSYARMKEVEPQLAAEVARWFAEADDLDRSEDDRHADGRGDEMPAWVQSKQERLAKIRAAMAALETEAAAEAAARDGDRRAAQEARARDEERPEPTVPRPHHMADGTPSDKAQRNFTDPESKLMMTKDGFVQGYNAQAAVDSASQVIVAEMVIAEQNDVRALAPMLAQIKANTGRQARELSADAGYCSEANLRELGRRHVRGYIATGRIKHSEGSAKGRIGQLPGTRAHDMRMRLARAGYRSRYHLRKQVVEPVFGQIKAALGFGRFLMRGMKKVQLEWRLVCTAHNLRKLLTAVGRAALAAAR